MELVLPAAKKPKDVSIESSIKGLHGKAWRVDLDNIRQKQNIPPENDGTLDIWIVEAPWAHPCWHSYAIILLHLRPLADNRPTKMYLKDATHEIWVQALDPNGDREQYLKDGTGCSYLTPVNFASQWIDPSDDIAKVHVQRAVRAITEGTLSPDTDFIRTWMHLFGDCMVKDKLRAGETRITIGDLKEIVIPAQPVSEDLLNTDPKN